MSDTANQLLTAFDSLPANEQHAVLVAMLSRSESYATEPLSDDQLTGLADELFLTLDQEEEDGSTTPER